jgi:hypothetical protein
MKPIHKRKIDPVGSCAHFKGEEYNHTLEVGKLCILLLQYNLVASYYNY